MPAAPAYSAGARYERDAIRDYLLRQPRTPETTRILAWLRARRRRYDARPGGLGK